MRWRDLGRFLGFVALFCALDIILVALGWGKADEAGNVRLAGFLVLLCAIREKPNAD